MTIVVLFTLNCFSVMYIITSNKFMNFLGVMAFTAVMNCTYATLLGGAAALLYDKAIFRSSTSCI